MTNVAAGAPGLETVETAAGAITAQPEVAEATQKAIDAQNAADEAKKSPEQRDADQARAEADAARAKAADELAAGSAVKPDMTVGETITTVDPEKSAGDHMAQVFRNRPANPATFGAEHGDPEKQTVRLYMDAPDHPEGRETTTCHPEMVGDYLRAGWSRA